MAASNQRARYGEILMRLLVLLLICLASTSGKQCHLSANIKNVVHVDLPWEVNVKVGRRIRVFCRLASDIITREDGTRLQVTSSNLRFKRLDRTEPFLGMDSPFVSEVDNATISFIKDPVTADDGGAYACVADVEGTKFPGCITTVRVRGKKLKASARTSARELRGTESAAR